MKCINYQLEENVKLIRDLEKELLSQITENDEYDKKAEEYETMHETTSRALYEKQFLIDECQNSMTPATPTNAVQPENYRTTKLPQIQLPSFSGRYADWLPFADQFKTAIGDSTKLSKVQKLVYLKSTVKGDAERLIKSIAENNYEVAMQILDDQYANQRIILRNLLNKLTDFKPVKSKSLNQIKLLHTTFVEVIQSMTAINWS